MHRLAPLCGRHRAPLEAELDITLVDHLGGVAEGRLMCGDDPVLMTMERVLEVLSVGQRGPSRIPKRALNC
jgi:hypothetical protein